MSDSVNTAERDYREVPAANMDVISSKADSPEMFDRISKRYDLLNHLLSFGTDYHWRDQAARSLARFPHDVVLDASCGTCDQLLSAFRLNKDIKFGFGVDPASKMLRFGASKPDLQRLGDRVVLAEGDGLSLPLADGSIDSVMISFGIRNIVDPVRALSEFYRVLKPGGGLVVLEFSLPRSRLIRGVYLLYFRRVLPWLGSVISGDKCAYRYLNKTVEQFYDQTRFRDMMRSVGFRAVQIESLTFGTATIYSGKKSDI